MPRCRHPCTPSEAPPSPLRQKTVKQPVNSRSGYGAGTERRRSATGATVERRRCSGGSPPGVFRGPLEDLLKAYGWGVVRCGVITPFFLEYGRPEQPESFVLFVAIYKKCRDLLCFFVNYFAGWEIFRTFTLAFGNGMQ